MSEDRARRRVKGIRPNPRDVQEFVTLIADTQVRRPTLRRFQPATIRADGREARSAYLLQRRTHQPNGYQLPRLLARYLFSRRFQTAIV